ncbi:hypothetical protein [Flagellimonas algicola]|uniref:hypothetical protein n=1 Tax=Flagellimonas algicola TaxID=2583815 RepID=UPI001F28C3CB|nr:hypothetical protein [Allomuricauda algicola]
MKENTIRTILCYAFILSHFGIILYLVYLHFYNEWINVGDFTASIAILTPAFTITTTAILKYVIDNRSIELSNGETANSMFVFVSFFIPIVYILSLIFIINRQTLEPINDYVAVLGILESLFGIYIGYVIRSLFDKKSGQ